MLFRATEMTSHADPLRPTQDVTPPFAQHLHTVAFLPTGHVVAALVTGSTVAESQSLRSRHPDFTR